jgi:short-subunit dehydrogenase
MANYSKVLSGLRDTDSRRLARYGGLSVGAAVALAGMMALRRNRRSLSGRVALITGGSRGLGLELSRRLAAEGCRLILVSRDKDELERAVAELSQSAIDVCAIPCDLTQKAEIRHMMQEALHRFRRVDILINNAGEITVGPIDAFSELEFERAMDLMFWAGVRTTLSLLPHLLRSGDADIVNVTSIGGKIAVPHLLPYTAAKFAMTGFSEGLQSELRGRGVHVLTVTPGLMRTGGHLHAQFAGDHDHEYRWFAVGATIPGLSMNVTRAASQIVDALIRRKREIALTLAAKSAIRIHGAFPTTALRVAELASSLILPKPSRETSHKDGKELHARQPALFKTFTQFGMKAARSQHQL